MQFKQTVLVVLSFAVAIRGSKDNPREKENRYNDNVSVMNNEINHSVRASREDISTATHPDPHHNSTSTTGFSIETKKIRMRRASQDDFSATVSKMATAARLITAISLQNGLIDGTIPSDTALAELLNIGSVDMAKLETFDKTKIDGFVQKLKNLQLLPSQDTFNEKMELLNQFRKDYEVVGDVQNLSMAKGYFTKVGKVKNNTIKKKLFTDVANVISKVGSILNGFLALPDDTATNAGNNYQYRADFVSLKVGIETFERFPANMTSWLETYEQFNDIVSGATLLKTPQRQLWNIVKRVESNWSPLQVTIPVHTQGLSGAFGDVSTALKDSEVAVTDFRNLEELVHARSVTKPSGLHTSGFLGGKEDLLKVADDAVNPDIKPFLAGFDQKTLQDGLKSIKTLGEAAGGVNWAPLSTGESVSAATSMRRITTTAEAVTKLAQTTDTTINAITSCGSPTVVLADYGKDLATTSDKSELLKKKLGAIRSKVTSLQKSPLLEDLKDLIKLKNFLLVTPQSTDNDVPALIAEFKKFKDNQKFIDTLTSLKPLLTALVAELTADDVNQMITDLAAGQPVFDKFLTEKNTGEYTTYLGCFKKVPEELESVTKSLQLLQLIRGLPANTQLTQQISVMSDALATSVPKIKTLREVPVSIKSNKDAAMAELKAKLKVPDSAAKGFGELVTVMDNVRKVLEKKTDLETFLTDGGAVEGKIKAESNAAKKQKMLDDWGDFEETKSEVEQLLRDLENQRNSIQKTARHRRATGPSSKFADFISTFSSFSNLQDVDLQVEKKLGVLNQLTDPSLNDLKANLRRLGSLDLQFARFNAPLNQAGGTLSSLDSSFVIAGPPGPATPAPGPGSGTGRGGTPGTPQGSSNAKGPQGSLTNMLISTAAASTDMLALIGYIIAGIVAAAVVGGLLYWFIFRKKKNKDDVEATKSRRATTSTTTATGNVTPEAKAAVEVDKAVKDVDKKVKSADEKKEMAEKEREKAQKERKEVEEQKLLAHLAVHNAQREMYIVTREKAAMGRVEEEVKGVIKNFNQKPNVLFVNRANMEGVVFKKEKGKFVYLFEIDREWLSTIQSFFMDMAWFPEYSEFLVNKLVKMKFHRKHSLISQYFEHEAIQPVNVQLSVSADNKFRNSSTNFVFNPEFATKYNGKTPAQVKKSELMPDWIHVNMIVYPVCGTVALAEAPMKNTREKFIKYIFEKKCPHIVMACTTFETDKYFEWDESKENTIQLGKFKVTVVKVEVVFDDQVAKRELLITKEDSKEQHTLTHWNFIHWDQNWCLSKTDTKYEHLFESIMKVHLATRLTEKPILVHSELGTGRGAVFVAAECIYQSSYDKSTTLDYPALVKSLRFQRFNFLENNYQYFFALVAGYYYFMNANGFKWADFIDFPGQIEWLRTWKKLTPAALKDFEFLDKEMARKQDPPTIADDLPKEAEVAVEPTKPDEKPAEVSTTQKPTEQDDNKADEVKKVDSLLDFNDDTPERHKKPMIEKKIKAKTAEKDKSQEEKKSQKDKKSQKSEKKV